MEEVKGFKETFIFYYKYTVTTHNSHVSTLFSLHSFLNFLQRFDPIFGVHLTLHRYWFNMKLVIFWNVNARKRLQ